ncbi:unnamed protein product [Allacma fusca]|uniref:Peptidase aspartic putative domain-containing protein n=1 Tax=Allacma fusca TaxID=39272 RepID=A0A8J2KHV9_9HEXA|nr:unnamed protein product [Allacma fusca]
MDFLDREMLSIQSSTAITSSGDQPQPKSQIGNNSNYQAKKETSIKKCLLCSADHPHFKCSKLTECPEKERRKMVDKAKLCTNCLGFGHGWKACKSTRMCRLCSQKHHSLLLASFPKTQPEKASTLSTNTATGITSQFKLKPTAVVSIANHEGVGVNCRALIDNCSDVTFIQESLVKALGLVPQKLPQKQVIEGLQSNKVTTITEFVTLEITSLYHPQIKYDVTAFLTKSIGGAYPQEKIDPSHWIHLPTTGLADPEYFLPKKVELLMSIDLHYEVIRSAIIRGKLGEPVAHESSFGWLVGGGTSAQPTKPRCNLTDSLDIQLQNFWDVEHGPTEQILLTAEKTLCQLHYDRTTVKLDDGSYQVELPFKVSCPSLGNSSSMALKRFYALENKFSRNEKLRASYTTAMEDLLRHGHRKYQEEIEALTQLRIPRWISISDPVKFQIIGFSDASEKAFAAAVYLRTITTTHATVQLVAAKTRGAPTKEQSLPKLELCGAVLLAQLITTVKSALQTVSTNVFAFTDSTITLAWITTDQPQRWKTFVRNRVITVQENVPAKGWYHVSGDLNPADLPSRGISTTDFLKSKLWFHGPECLQSLVEKPMGIKATREPAQNCDKEEKSFPTLKPHHLKQFLAEKRPDQQTVLLVNQVSSTLPHLHEIQQYSNWNRLIRHVSWWILLWRYHLNHQSKQHTEVLPCLNTATLQHTEERIVLFLQQSAFPEEVKALQQQKSLNKKSSLLSLSPFLQNGLLRVAGRIKMADLPFDTRHPLLLPKHHVTDLLIQSLHLQLQHGGTSPTLSILQRRYWVIRGRTHVKEAFSYPNQA